MLLSVLSIFLSPWAADRLAAKTHAQETARKVCFISDSSNLLVTSAVNGATYCTDRAAAPWGLSRRTSNDVILDTIQSLDSCVNERGPRNRLDVSAHPFPARA